MICSYLFPLTNRTFIYQEYFLFKTISMFHIFQASLDGSLFFNDYYLLIIMTIMITK